MASMAQPRAFAARPAPRPQRMAPAQQQQQRMAVVPRAAATLDLAALEAEALAGTRWGKPGAAPHAAAVVAQWWHHRAA